MQRIYPSIITACVLMFFPWPSLHASKGDTGCGVMHTFQRAIEYADSIGATSGGDTTTLTPGQESTEIQEVAIPGTFHRHIDTTNAIPLTPTTPGSEQFVGIVDGLDLDQLDDEGEGQSANTMVTLSHDVFLKGAAFQFFPFGYRTRGYEGCYEQKYINGVHFRDALRGVFNYPSIGALNDMTRKGDRIPYMGVSPFSLGDIGGSENINMRPSNYTRGGKFTLSGTNRQYYLRAMLSYNSGLMDNGWALSGSIGGRYSHEGFIKGVFYQNIAYMLGAEKVWGNGLHSLSFITFGSPVRRGQQGASVQEAVALVGSNLYNPNWGLQGGKMRNARVVKSWDPTAILSHVWKPNLQLTLTTGIAAHYNRYGRSALNWYNGSDPRPDYYRYLPSYFAGDTKTQQFYEELWKEGRISQIDWDRLYEVNRLNNQQTNASAIYMVEERRSDLAEIALNSTVNTQLTERISLDGGVEFKYSHSRQFKTVDDLLGADYLLDYDKYAERDFGSNRVIVQNDLNRPDRRVGKGDVFGYDYRYHIYNGNIWAQAQHEYEAVNLYYGVKLGFNTIRREGRMRNGRYPDDSYGRGALHAFADCDVKLGGMYKIGGRHFITANASYLLRPQLEREIYISPDITDRVAPELKHNQVVHIDLNYIFTVPGVRGRVTAFYTGFFNSMKKVAYYHDTERTFTLHTLYGMNRAHYGGEVGIEYRPVSGLTLELIGTVAQYYYTNNPMGVLNSTNGRLTNQAERVYMKKLHLGGVPEMVGTLGVGYFYKYWFFNLYFNGFGYNHIDVAPVRRLESPYTGITPPGTPGHNAVQYAAYEQYTTQEWLKGGFTMDLSVGKILYLKNRDRMNFNLSIVNLLNNRRVRTGGYEQGRILLDHPEWFTNKHFYMQGINFFLNVSYIW